MSNETVELCEVGPGPESEPVIVTEVRGEGAHMLPKATAPSPEPDPEVVTKARGEDPTQWAHMASTSTPSPEPDEEYISHARGEDAFVEPSGGDKEHRETAVRGEDTGGEQTRVRGEDPDRFEHGPTAQTGTFTRGESDFDAPYLTGEATKTGRRGESDFDLDGTRLTAYLNGGTESKDGRGTVDYDAEATVHDAALDDPTDLRRITVLGALEARQKSANR